MGILHEAISSRQLSLSSIGLLAVLQEGGPQPAADYADDSIYKAYLNELELFGYITIGDDGMIRLASGDHKPYASLQTLSANEAPEDDHLEDSDEMGEMSDEDRAAMRESYQRAADGQGSVADQFIKDMVDTIAFGDHDSQGDGLVGMITRGDEDLDRLWLVFHKAYPGRKRGPDTEFNNFKAKYAKGGKWRTLLPEMCEHLERQVAEREAYQAALDFQIAAGNKHHGMFLPFWKNLRTYINQGAWEESYPLPAHIQSVETKAVVPTEEGGGLYQRYYTWAKQFATEHLKSAALAETLVLRSYEFNDIVSGRVAPFKGYENYVTYRALLDLIKEWHEEYFTNQFHRRDFATALLYCKDRFGKIRENS